MVREFLYEAYYAGNLNNDAINYEGQTFFDAVGATDANGNPDNYPLPLASGAINPFTDTLAHPINWAPFTESVYSSQENHL